MTSGASPRVILSLTLARAGPKRRAPKISYSMVRERWCKGDVIREISYSMAELCHKGTYSRLVCCQWSSLWRYCWVQLFFVGHVNSFSRSSNLLAYVVIQECIVFLSRVSTLKRDIDIAILPSVSPSVCQSVCPWRYGIRWKRLNILS